jgi:pimeloyl-ACP methyl ester carboxylesterase
VVVHFHGNAEIIDDQDDVIAFYRERGFSVLLPEYRGYGRSAGTPSQKGIRADAENFYQRLVARPDVDKTRIVFQGRSVGCGVAADLAAHHPPSAMVMISPFLSATSMAWKFYAPPLLVRHPYRTDKVLRELDAPVLIFHGSHDEIIPFSQGQALSKIPKRCDFVPYDCGHNDFPGVGNDTDFEARIDAFLKREGLIRD